MELEKHNDGGSLTYFNCSLLSCYIHEDERLFFGGKGKLQFKSIRLVSEKKNLFYYIHSLMNFNKIINGERVPMWKVTSSDFNIICKLIDPLSSSNKNKFHEYIQKSWQLFKNKKKIIKINKGCLP